MRGMWGRLKSWLRVRVKLWLRDDLDHRLRDEGDWGWLAPDCSPTNPPWGSESADDFIAGFIRSEKEE